MRVGDGGGRRGRRRRGERGEDEAGDGRWTKVSEVTAGRTTSSENSLNDGRRSLPDSSSSNKNNTAKTNGP